MRAARTELFSTPAASSDPVPATPVAPVVVSDNKEDKKGKAAAGPIKVGCYFGLWYMFNIGYNIYNKRLLNVLPLPWMTAAAQMGIGLLYVFPLWATKLRKAPKLSKGALGPLRYDVQWSRWCSILCMRYINSRPLFCFVVHPNHACLNTTRRDGIQQQL